MQNCMNHTRQYTIVHSDQHQYSEVVRTATIKAQTTQWTTNAHRSRTHQTCKYHTTFYTSYETQNTPKLTHCYTSSQIQHATNRETESTIIEYGTWRYLICTRELPCKTQQQIYPPPPQEGLPAPPHDDIYPRCHRRIYHAQPQHIHGTEAKITATGLHTQDRIQSHTRNQQTTSPRNNQEAKQRH
jgi:hypothetical protein